MKIFLVIFAALTISACSSTGSSSASYMNDGKTNSSFNSDNIYYDDSRRNHGSLSNN
ncbi:hypothetical protein L3V35_16325 [Vibrio sp. L5-1]|uniref:hypothetical protein n=1 Tax=Vibrio sp. L5-1 TaxID=2912254 RepID=UPI001F34699A|nr:hypothetical protein [Vibrio sp. L5-1]MCF7496597.1 hypothetical protein [Vibrio sp. L5-1]